MHQPYTVYMDLPIIASDEEDAREEIDHVIGYTYSIEKIVCECGDRYIVSVAIPIIACDEADAIYTACEDTETTYGLLQSDVTSVVCEEEVRDTFYEVSSKAASERIVVYDNEPKEKYLVQVEIPIFASDEADAKRILSTIIREREYSIMNIVCEEAEHTLDNKPDGVGIIQWLLTPEERGG